MERTLGMATRFLDEVREEVARAASDGADTPPRVRSVHERPGHATPEFRTLTIPIPTGVGAVSPEILSTTIARYAVGKKPDALLLVLEAEMEREDGRTGPVLIAEGRDRAGTRLFWMQGYRVQAGRVTWEDPLGGGWRDPGEEEMILDAAFGRPTAAAGKR
jgi:hypothetical protein